MTLLLMAVVAALVMMFSFVRGSVASRFKTGADAFGHGLRCNNMRAACQ